MPGKPRKKRKKAPAPAFAEVTISRAGGLSVTVRGVGRGGDVAAAALQLYTTAAEVPSAATERRPLGFVG